MTNILDFVPDIVRQAALKGGGESLLYHASPPSFVVLHVRAR